MSELKLLESEQGPVRIRPSVVSSIHPGGDPAWSNVRCGDSWYYVKGSVEEVHAILFPKEERTAAESSSP